MRSLLVSMVLLVGGFLNTHVQLANCLYDCHQYSCNTTHIAYDSGLPARQLQELRDLQTILNGAEWTRSWPSDADYCSWAGIGCCASNYTIVEASGTYDNTTPRTVFPLSGCCCQTPGAIASVTLPYNNVSGSLSGVSFTHLGETLLHVRLQGNSLKGTLPTSLTQLKRLQSMDVSDNGLAGSIPAALSSMTGLQALMLGSNQLTGTIPAALSALSRLVDFVADQNQLQGRFPVDLLQLDTLNILHLGNNFLSGALDAGGVPARAGQSLCEWHMQLHLH